jgi:hypothetical protein
MRGSGGFRSAEVETVGRESVHTGSPRSRERLVIFSTPLKGPSVLSQSCAFGHKRSCDIPFCLFRYLTQIGTYPLILFQSPLRATIRYKASRMSLPCQVAARHSDSMRDNARLVTSRFLFSCPGVVIVFYFTIIADEIAYL